MAMTSAITVRALAWMIVEDIPLTGPVAPKLLIARSSDHSIDGE